MRFIVAAVGRLKDAERDLYVRYASRLDALGRSHALGPVALAEIGEGRGGTPELRKADESARLLKAASSADVKIALDEAGRGFSSEEFARVVAKHQDAGCKTLAFLIGGPDGQGMPALEQATVKLSLGPMTLTHGLARIVLAEQLYRAATIIAGHPYHRV
jgi:23S rRNA (pseudouridine1915-N3)-methyltransferase